MNQSLKQYAEVARLWVIDYERAISVAGVANTLSGPYTTKESLYSDIEKQLRLTLESDDLEKDISFDEAMLILKGQNVR